MKEKAHQINSEWFWDLRQNSKQLFWLENILKVEKQKKPNDWVILNTGRKKQLLPVGDCGFAEQLKGSELQVVLLLLARHLLSALARVLWSESESIQISRFSKVI